MPQWKQPNDTTAATQSLWKRAKTLHLKALRRQALACQSDLAPTHTATHMPTAGPTAIATYVLRAFIGVSEWA